MVNIEIYVAEESIKKIEAHKYLKGLRVYLIAALEAS